MFKSVRNQKHPCSDSWRIREPAGLGDACTAAARSAWTALSTRMGGPFRASHVSSHVTSCGGPSSRSPYSSASLLGPSHIMALVHSCCLSFHNGRTRHEGKDLVCHAQVCAPSTHQAPGHGQHSNVSRVNEYILDSSWIRMAFYPSSSADWLRELGQVISPLWTCQLIC